MSRGKAKLSASQRNHLLELLDAGTHTQEELAERLSVSRTTLYKGRQRRAATASSRLCPLARDTTVMR